MDVDRLLQLIAEDISIFFARLEERDAREPDRLTPLDEFARSAMEGILSSQAEGFRESTGVGNSELAFECYDIAESMIAEKLRREAPTAKE